MKIVLLLLSVLALATSKSFRQQCTPPTDFAYHIDNAQDPTGSTQRIKGPKTDQAWEFKNGGYRTLGQVDLGADVSVSFWATWYSLKRFSRIIDFGDGADVNNYVIYLSGTSTNISIFRKVIGNSRYQVDLNNVVQTYYYNHYTIIFHASGEISVYINGKDLSANLVKHGVPQTAQQDSNNRKTQAYIGKSHWGGQDELFEGVMDELMIFNRVLTQQEITCLNDMCDNSCFSTCQRRSDNCDTAPSEHTDGNSSTCPVPQNPLYSFANLDTFYTTTGTLSKTTGPVSSNALVFNGQDAWTKFKYSDIYGGEMSFSVWARWDALNTWSRIFDFGNGANRENILLANEGTTTTVNFNIKKHALTTGESNGTTQANGVEVGKWHQYVCTVDRNGNAKLYIDGREVGNSFKSFDFPIAYVYRANSYVGKSNWDHDALFQGAMDDFQVYGRVLKPEEIQCLAKRCEIACTNNQNWCAHTSSACQLDNCATVFSDCNYRGSKQVICQNNPQLEPMEIRSIKIPSGYKLRLYSAINYGAQIAEFSSNQECLQSIPFVDNVNNVFLQIEEQEVQTEDL